MSYISPEDGTVNHRTFAFALTTLLTTVTASPAARAAERVQTEQKVAVVRVEIRQADGTVIRARPQAVQWGAAASFQIDPAHALRVTTGADVSVDYARGGTAIEAVPTQADVTRKVFRTEDDAEIVVRVTPTKVRVSHD